MFIGLGFNSPFTLLFTIGEIMYILFLSHAFASICVGLIIGIMHASSSFCFYEKFHERLLMPILTIFKSILIVFVLPLLLIVEYIIWLITGKGFINMSTLLGDD